MLFLLGVMFQTQQGVVEEAKTICIWTACLFCWRVFFLQQLCKPREKTLHEEWMHHDACHKTIPTWVLPFHCHATTTTYVLDKENCQIVCKRNDWSLIGYPETGEFFANMKRSYGKIIIQILHFVHAFIVAWVDLLREMLQHYGWRKFASAFQVHWPNNNELGVRDKWERL
jgi:hypothetical protein